MLSLLAGAGAGALGVFRAGDALAMPRMGRVDPPEPVPDIVVVRDDGVRTTLPQQLRGRVTALHFMFTGCSSTCPIQGATFARLQERLALQRGDRLQLLSVSVDPLGDDPAALERWLRRLSAGPQWRAAVPIPAHGARLLQWAGGPTAYSADTHAQHVLLIDDRARLALRSTDLPDAAQIAALLRALEASPRG